MLVEGSHFIPFSPELVWRALNEPDILQKTIPNCAVFEKKADHLFFTKIGLHLGPLPFSLRGTIEVTTKIPASQYTLVAKGEGMIAKLGEVITHVYLERIVTGKTNLVYQSHLALKGRLEKIEPEWIGKKSKDVANRFFTALINEMESRTLELDKV